jgi:pimeloyl-ACP methyl ester carboxylesterase
MSRKATFIIAMIMIASFTLGPLPTQAAPSHSVSGNPLAASNTLPFFTKSSTCAFPVTRTQIIIKQVSCGYVTVPELHSNPQGNTIRLAVAVYHRSTGASPRSAFILLQGGPGGSSDVFAQLLDYKNIYDSFTANHDVIVFDQRGVGHSRPALTCSSATSSLTCARYWQGQGVNLAAYNTAEDAADVNDIRIALGYDALDVYAVSYGTYLAQVLLRDHPEAVRDVVLDSVVPLGSDPDLGAPAAFSGSLTALFAACAADAACNNTYPDLHDVFTQLFTRLNSNPIRVTTTDPATGRRTTLTLNGSDLVGILHEGLYSSAELGVLPMLLYETSNGNYTLLSEMVSGTIGTNESVSDVVYYSVECSDMVRALTPEQIKASLDGVLPEIAQAEGSTAQDVQNICKTWPGNNFNQPALDPLYSDKPTLVMGSDFDPITPPEYAHEVEANLSNAYYVELPADAHAAALSEPCAFRLMLNFLNDPIEPDPSCIGGQRVQFVTQG